MRRLSAAWSWRRWSRVVAVGSVLAVAAVAWGQGPARSGQWPEDGQVCPEPLERLRPGQWAVGGVRIPLEVLPYRDHLCQVVDLAVVASVVASEGTLRSLGLMAVPRTTARLFVEVVARGEAQGPWIDVTYGGGWKNDLWVGDLRLEVGSRYLLLLLRDRQGAYHVAESHSMRGVLALDTERRMPTSRTAGNYWETACAFPLDVPQRPLASGL